MSDVRYAFSDPCGMEMIIMVIIQHLNNPFSVRNTGKHICPGTWCWCLSATTNMSVLVRDIGGDREARLGKGMKRVQCLQFNWDKLSQGRKSCFTLYPIPSSFSYYLCTFPLLSLAPINIEEIGLEVEQISVMFTPQLGEGMDSLYGFFPSFCFSTTFFASFYALILLCM